MGRRGRVMRATQIATPRGDNLAVEIWLRPLWLSCFLGRAEPRSRLGNVLWCNHSDVRVASEVFSVKVKRWVMP